jgi:hypothetical protein
MNLLNTTYRNEKKPASFLDTYFSSAEKSVKNEVEHKYKLSSSEGLPQIMLKDNGRIFHLEILKLHAHLITINLMHPWIEPQRFVNSKQKVIAKKYKSLGDLQKDNNTPLKFDSDLDVVDYSIFTKFKKAHAKELSTVKMAEMFAEYLAQEYGCSRTNTDQMASILMQDHQMVQEGDYAKLELKPSLPRNVEECELTTTEKRQIEIEADTRKIIRYYVRLNNTWVYDRSIEDDRAFAKPKNMFCKLNPVEKKEIVYSLGKTQDEMVENIQLEIDKYSLLHEQSFSIDEMKKLSHDYFHSKLGNTQLSNIKIQSPYFAVLQKILHTSNDFVDKQTNIISFYDRFCREPIPNVEDPNWKYCQQTSTKLLQKSLYDLSIAFFNGNYNSTLERICKTNGKRSDDGNCIVDKYGGNVLCFMDFSEEGYEWMNLVEGDEDENEEEIAYTEKKTDFKGDEKQMDHWIALICKEIGISGISEPAMNYCIEFKKTYLKPDAFRKIMEKDKKKTVEEINTAVKTYETQTLNDIVICSIVLTIQTSEIKIPKRKTRKCNYSLDGYPLGTDNRTIEYMACLCKQLHTEHSKFPSPKNNFNKRIMAMFEKIVKDENISKLLQKKRDSLLLNNEPVPEILNVANQWIHFYPPTVPVEIQDKLHAVSKPQHEEFIIQMKKGSPNQWQQFGVNQVNIMRHSFGVLETINEIVEKQDAILKTQLQKPFLENACCSEIGQKNPWLYFVEKQPSLQTYHDVVLRTGNMLYSLSAQVKAPFLHLKATDFTTQSTLALPNVLCAYSEALQYTVMIRYCNLDSEIYPIPTHLSNIVREKHREYNSKGSIEEKIAFFKEKNQSLSFAKFTNMMSLIQNQNSIQRTLPIEIKHEGFNEWKTMLASQKQPNKYIQPDLLALFTKMFESSLDEKRLDEMENALEIQIKKYKETVNTLSSDIGKRKIDKIINDITKFANEDIPVASKGSFVKNYLYLLCILKTNTRKPNIPDHWGLLPLDENKLSIALEKTTEYENLAEPLKTKMKLVLKPFYHFISPFLTFFPLKRTKLWNRFFTFVLFYVFNSYIYIITEPDSLESDELSKNDKDIEPVDIQEADIKVKQIVIQFMTDVFKNEQKSMILYEDILKNVSREREVEKSEMKNHFDQMEKLERNAEAILKKLRLEQFYIDPKTLQKYGKKRDKMIHDVEGELQEEIIDVADVADDADEEESVLDFLEENEDDENDEYDMAEYEG